MIYFLYGEDTYRSWQKLWQLRQKYVDASKGDTDLIILDGATMSPADFIHQTQTLPLLANRRLIIIKNLLKAGEKATIEAVANRLDKLSSGAVLVFYEAGRPDRRTKLFQGLNQPRQAQAFDPLIGPALIRYVIDLAKAEGLTMSPSIAQQCLALTGADLWRVHHELTKLSLYKLSLHKNEQDDNGQDKNEHRKITEADIALLISGQSESKIFDLTDAFGQRKAQTAVALLVRHQNDDNHLGLLAMIAGHYRNLLLVADGQRRRLTKSQLANRLQLHPFVLDKAYAQAQGYDFDELANCYRYLFELDLAAKQSIIEPYIGLTVLAANLAQKPLRLPRLTEETVLQ